jgi:hypothetical protein
MLTSILHPTALALWQPRNHLAAIDLLAGSQTLPLRASRPIFIKFSSQGAQK